MNVTVPPTAESPNFALSRESIPSKHRYVVDYHSAGCSLCLTSFANLIYLSLASASPTSTARSANQAKSRKPGFHAQASNTKL